MTPFELQRAEKKEVWDRTNPFFLGFLQASASYGQLATRSALLLNGGALFALPPFAAAMSGTTNVGPTLIQPASCFVVGIVTAALCAYAAYWNFQYNIAQLGEMVAKEMSEIEEGYDDTYKHRLQKSRADFQQERTRGITKFGRRISLTLWFANAFGVFSYIAFVTGSWLLKSVFVG